MGRYGSDVALGVPPQRPRRTAALGLICHARFRWTPQSTGAPSIRSANKRAPRTDFPSIKWEGAGRDLLAAYCAAILSLGDTDVNSGTMLCQATAFNTTHGIDASRVCPCVRGGRFSTPPWSRVSFWFGTNSDPDSRRAGGGRGYITTLFQS